MASSSSKENVDLREFTLEVEVKLIDIADLVRAIRAG